jgi:hypothetical protein
MLLSPQAVRSLAWYNLGMIDTILSPTLAATVVHRVAGTIGREQSEQAAAEALQLVHGAFGELGPLNLVLDLRGMHFENLQAHKAWSQGFARNPALHGLVRRVAIIGDDTPAFRAEQEIMATERVQFFLDPALADQWLARVAQGEHT